jgi:hypothetical protein
MKNTSLIPSLQLGNLRLKITDNLIHISYPDNHYYYFVNTKILFLLVFIFLIGFFYIVLYLSGSIIKERKTQITLWHNQSEVIQQENQSDELLGSYTIDYFENLSEKTNQNTTVAERFITEKNILLAKYLLKHKVSRLDQLSDSDMLALAQELSHIFHDLVLGSLPMEPHVQAYWKDSKEIRKIETALIEQIKFHIPASITLSQSALETAYGKRVINNNYFGIKDKTNQTSPITTTEYYSEAEFKANKQKVISYKKVQKGKYLLYQCVVKDSFSKYNTAWESFRAHSLFLKNSERYAVLFTKGKDYSAWADAIGATKYGGVGYATSPIYGEILKKIIQRYQLDLLDF